MPLSLTSRSEKHKAKFHWHPLSQKLSRLFHSNQGAMKMWTRMKLELVEVCIRGLLVLLICVLDAGSRGQMVCDTEASTHWLLVPQTLEVRWTLSKKTCSSPEECWGIRGHGHEEELSSTLWTFPQMCPVQLQVGDKLLVLADDTLESYGIHLMNVSKESFRSCSTTGYPADQLLFPGHVKGTVEVDPKWLLPGTQHLVAVREGDPELCKVGLRLVVRVRGHRCRRTTSEQLCAGNGACRAAVQDNMFNCACRRGFSGRFCERFGGRPSGRHGARSLCMRRGPAYECVCPSRPAGMNCSKVTHLCNERCVNGRCESVAPNSIRCMCDLGFTGT
ncbi:protein eyes shut homolog [Paramormyrops kingsleyae]|uniref:protein eyes shut homolog n=1 Tax=Paramormyrops kingsleyae TaxID=1676925 RepID=UPI003B979AF2